MTQADGREWLICSCGWMHIAAEPGERGRSTCVRCGKPSSSFQVASRSQVEALPDGINVSMVDWPGTA